MGKVDFGYILRRLRHDRAETLEQVSEATGLSAAMLSRIERGERLPSPDSVEALARHFDLPVDYLMSETIAQRLLNRYGEASAKSAAEHMQRESPDRDLHGIHAEESRGLMLEPLAQEPQIPAQRERRAYGPFREHDVLAALRAIDEMRSDRSDRPALAAPVPAAPSAAAAPLTGRTKESERTPRLDSATEQVLRAAREASEAAAVLVRRETPALSREARLALVDRIAPLAEQATEVLQMLMHDPDPRVRTAARDALRRLMRGL
jgi:transcriptional regulator with XRE-family HTH domain